MVLEYHRLKKAIIEKKFSHLNDMQRKAVFHTEGPLLILAGAGSGKTTVLVNRAANIIYFGNAYNSEYVPENLSQQDLQVMEDYLNGDVGQEQRVRSLIAVDPVKPWQIL